MPSSPPADETETPSKSQLKRDAEQIRKLGAELVKLSEKDWQTLQLDLSLQEALKQCKQIHSNAAHKRQLQYIGKLMRQTDNSHISAFLQQKKTLLANAAREHKQLEQLRDKLIAQGDEAISELLKDDPTVDRQKLRQLVLAARKAEKINSSPAAARALFRFLRDEITSIVYEPANLSSRNAN
ncbi:MAG: ribosome biogenesis factor YjgA [Gammaproteobacteria bacterium]